MNSITGPTDINGYSTMATTLPTSYNASSTSLEERLLLTDYNFTNNSNDTFFPRAVLLSQSLWNVFDEQYLRHSWEWTIALVVTYVLILVIGVIGNCMVILVVALRPQMRSVTNMFIMNLAVADLFVSVFCVFPTLLANVFQPWILESVMCKAVAYIQGVSVCASAYSLSAISLDRCQAIYLPFRRPRGLSETEALRTISFIWLIALLITLPWAVIFDVIISEDDGLTYCVETWEDEYHGKIYFLVANLIFCYGLPLVLISVSNAIIWCHVSHRKVPQNSASEGTIRKMHKKARHGVRKMLGIVTLTFLLSWLPLYIIVTRMKFSTHISDWESDFLDISYPFAQWLGSWNSSVNPVLYAFLNNKFREMFRSIIPRWIPFVRKTSELRRNTRFAGYHVTVSNGTYTGTFVTPGHTTGNVTRNSSDKSFRHSYLRSPSPRFHNRPTELVCKYEECKEKVSTTKLVPQQSTENDVYFDCVSKHDSVSSIVTAQVSPTVSIANL